MKKTIGFAALSLVVLVVIALFISPKLLKNYFVKNSKELVGRQVSIDKLSINYFKGKLSVYNFKMYEADQEEVFVAFDTLILNTVPYKYFSNTIALDQFYLDGLEVNISQKEDAYNFDDLIEFYSSEEAEQASPKAYKYFLNNLELKRASLNFYDGKVDHTTSLENLAFFIPQINWNQESESEADIEFQIADGGNIEADFQMHPKTKDFDGEIRISGLQLKSYYNYLLPYANVNAIDGVLGTKISLSGNSQSPKDIEIASEIVITNFELLDTNDKSFLASKKISGEISAINLKNKDIHFKSVLLEQPYINFELDSLSNNISRIFKLDTEEATAENTNNTETFDYSIQSFKITDGIMDYSDNLTGRPFQYHFNDIKVSGENISNTKDWIEFNANMLLNNRGKLKAEIGINPQKSMTAQIDVAVENFLLSDLDIYSNYYTGHSFLVGDMVYFSSTKLNNGNLNSDNKLLIKNVDVKNNKGGVYTLPLKLAIWVLKDREGNIELEVPVAGNLNDPQVDTWALVWATLKKRIFNAADNPARPLARYLKVKPEEIERIEFHYPDSLITESQANQLDLILKLEREKENIGILMEYLADPEIINRSIAEQEGIPYKVDSIQSLETANPKLLDSLNTLVSSGNYRPENKVLDSLANNYSEAVIRNISKYLQEKNPQTLIKVQKAKVSNYQINDAKPQIKIKYTAKEEEEELEEDKL